MNLSLLTIFIVLAIAVSALPWAIKQAEDQNEIDRIKRKYK